MEHSANFTHSSADREKSTGELVQRLSEQVSLLVRDELRMARLELSRKGKQAGAWLAAVLLVRRWRLR